MIRLYRDIMKAVEPLVEAEGGTATVEIASGKKHNRLVIQLNGYTESITLACTPHSKNFAVQHKVNDVKRFIRKVKAL